MPADYSKFRTPFFEISIGDSLGNNMNPLPPQIARLVEKVEIMETLCCNSFNQITITFNEGSREPYGVDKGTFASPAIYPSDGQGILSNQSGSLVDLKITGGGFSNLSESLTSAISAAAGAASEALGLFNQIQSFFTLFGKSNDNPLPIELPDPDISVASSDPFLLQQRNQVLVTWGYKEDPASVRCARGYIMVVTSEFPEKGTPKTTVIAHSAAGIADQITTQKTVRFGTEVPSGISESGLPLTEAFDLPPSVLIPKLCTENGLGFIVSTDFETPEQGEGRDTIWLAGESLHQSFTRLARRHNAVYKLETNPCTGKDTVIFVNENEWQKDPVLGASKADWMTYKGNGSILKSVSIKADYGQPVGTFLKSITEEGAEIGKPVDKVKHPAALFEKHQDNFPVSGANPTGISKFASKIAKGTTSFLGVSAENSPAAIESMSGAENDKKGSNIVAMDFTTLGYPKLTPGNVKFSGIGERYTGYYNVQNVTHILDSQGYNCRGIATSFKNADGGVEPEGTNTIEEKKVELQQFASSPAMTQYRSQFIDNGSGGITE